MNHGVGPRRAAINTIRAAETMLQKAQLVTAQFDLVAQVEEITAPLPLPMGQEEPEDEPERDLVKL